MRPKLLGQLEGEEQGDLRREKKSLVDVRGSASNQLLSYFGEDERIKYPGLNQVETRM